ncbi:hypothetical protein ACET3X_010019 [Alternaria dauci]|uniref:Uncharacterized protein n=1 Tax=Alternaria dauci TaxID=48095 RepID=A0ABR3U8H3_9PLEO
MPVLPEGPIWFQHSSLKREHYDPANDKIFYKYLLLEVVVNKPTRFKQGILGDQYHSRTIEHTIGYEDNTLPAFPNNQTNYRKWKYMSVMYGPEAKCITEWTRLKSSVSTGDIVDRHNNTAPKIYLVPVRMPTAIEQFLWLDLTYPVRAIYLPRQHKVDNGAYSDWCMFQHLSFRHRKLDFSAYIRSGEKTVTEEDRANFSISIDGVGYKSGDQYLLDVIERLGTESQNKESASESLSKLKELKEEQSPSLRSALEARLGEMCDKDKYEKNEATKRWAKDFASIDERYQRMIEDSKQGFKDMKKKMVETAGIMHLPPGKFDNLERIGKYAIENLENARNRHLSIPHGDALEPDEEKKLQEKMSLYWKTVENARYIDKNMDDAMRKRLKMNTYTRKPITFERDDEYGWNFRPGWIARFDISLIYNSTMLPRGWLSDDYHSAYCGVSIFSTDSINIPSDWSYGEREMFSNAYCCDLVEILKKEWGVRLKYDDLPVEPEFVWGLINSITQIGLGLVPGWGPLLVYGDTLLYNLIFTDTFSKVWHGDRDSVTALSLQSVALLTGVGPSVRKLLKGGQDGSAQALMQLTMARK